MKLVSCFVSSFGKLKDFEYNFSDGLNTIKEDNGWGKSTLATFIKAMFYGLDGSAKRNVADNERKKFKPWNSTETFGGTINFIWGGNEYKIERFFGAKETDDTVSLYDVKTGKKFSNTENLGKRIFEIDEEGFLSTTYFSQKDFEIKSNTSITAKFNSLCGTDDTDAFDKALAKVEQKAKTYKYSGDRGIINDCKREIYAVNEQIEKVNGAYSNLDRIKNDIALLTEKTKRLKSEANDLAEKVSKAGRAEAVAVKKARYNELRKEKELVLSEKSSLEQVLNGKTPSDNELTAYQGIVEELKSVSVGAKIAAEDLARIDNNTAKKDDKLSKKQRVSIIAICLLFFIEGITTIWFNLVAGLIGFGLFLFSAILLCFALVFSGRDKDEKLEQILESSRARLNEYLAMEKEYVNRLNAYLSGYKLPEKMEYNEAIAFIVKTVERLLVVNSKLPELTKQIDEIASDKSIFESINDDNQDVFLIKERLKVVQTEYGEGANDLASRLALLREYEERVDKLYELEGKKSDLLEKVDAYSVEYETLKKTAEFLKQADENLKVKYRAPLQDSLNKYLSLIASKEKTAKIDIDLNVSIEEKGGEKHTDYYSKGYQNLFEICKRFALTDVLFTGEKPFVILDDPFFNLDDKKIDAAISLVKRLSKEYQIIYFVCHESRRA